MNRVLDHLCAHIYIGHGPGQPHGDGEMNDMALPSRHRIRNSIPGGLKPSALHLGHRGSPRH